MLPSNHICFNPSTMPIGIKLQSVELGFLDSHEDLVNGIPDSFTVVEDLSKYPVFINQDHICIVFNGLSKSQPYQMFKVLEDYTDLSKAFEKYLDYITLYFKDGDSRTFYPNSEDNLFQTIGTFKFVDYEYEIKDEFDTGELKVEDEVSLDLIYDYLSTTAEANEL